MLKGELKLKKQKIVGIMLTLIILSVLTFALNLQSVNSNSNTICVDDDNAASPWDRTYYENVMHASVHSTQYPWSMFRHNLRHTGYTESPAPNTNRTQWTYTTKDAVVSSPAVANGTVFVGSANGKVYALDQYTGEHLWGFTTGGFVFSSPAVAGGNIYVGSWDHKVYCLNASTGACIWSYATGFWVWSSPAVADGLVFVGSDDYKVYAFGNIIRVPQDYSTIAEAIEAATPGATITIAPGTYHEVLVINKPLRILGQKGSSTDFVGGGSGIAITLLPGASGSTIEGIVITRWDQGILLLDSGNCKIYDNIMSLMKVSGIALAGSNAANNFIYYNIFQDSSIAINLTASSTSNTIYKNIISLNNIGLDLESNGNIIYANTIAENKVGIDMSNSNGNIIYHNSFVDNTVQISISTSGGNVWDDGYPSGGNYWSTHTSPDLFSGPNQNGPGSDGIVDTPYIIAVYNIDRYPLVQPFSPHDIGVTGVITSKTVVGQGFTLWIDLKILNYGLYDETFGVTAYANTIIIATQTVTLPRRNSIALTFTWNTAGFAKGSYTISSYATLVLGETDTTDNTYVDGDVIVAMIGDISGPLRVPDGRVDIRDVALVAKHFGQDVPPALPNCDLTGPTTGVPDGKVDIRDIAIVAKNFGKIDP